MAKLFAPIGDHINGVPQWFASLSVHCFCDMFNCITYLYTFVKITKRLRENFRKPPPDLVRHWSGFAVQEVLNNTLKLSTFYVYFKIKTVITS